MISRRNFVRLAAALRASPALPQGPLLYFIDGYHGGSRGHMPPGTWRDILNRLRDFPDWKLALEVEPASWDQLRREDPQAYSEVRKLLADKSVRARLEIVGNTFGQHFGWAFSGESNIRQLTRGLEIVRRHFPGTTVETYAVQVPCWTSCLPQILRSLGYRYASLKSTTMFVGYTTGVDAEVVDWVGPDGTAVAAVPRYACEEFVGAETTEGPLGTPDYTRRCVKAGIAHPISMALQDLGWSAKPRASGGHIRYVTWREYMANVAVKPVKEWRLSQEDIRCALPWGDRDVHHLAGQVRAAENRVVFAEKMAAIASALAGAPFPAAPLDRAWEQVLWTQHHDAWNSRRWLTRVTGQVQEVHEICDAAVDAAAEALAEPAGKRDANIRALRVFNTLAAAREDVVQVGVAFDPDTTGARVTDEQGREVPSQLSVARGYRKLETLRAAAGESRVFGWSSPPSSEGGINSAIVTFRAKAPSAGYSTYRIEPVLGKRAAPPSIRVERGKTVSVETDLYRIQLDPARGGAITSLLAKDSGKEYCDASSARLFNEYRGYFIAAKAWRSSAAEPARVEVVENGPVRARLSIAGRIGGHPVRTFITLANGQRRIDFSTTFRFDEDTWIGDPWDMKPEETRKERRRSHYDTRWSLQTFFPVSLKNRTLYKNAAFDVCRSTLADTFYQRWDEIKHNVIVNWVDVVDREAKHGLAVLSDRTTAYTHAEEHPLALVMGWGWIGGYWWGRTPLRGEQRSEYAVVPHTGRWDRARLWEENERWTEPLLAQVMPGAPTSGEESRSLLTFNKPGYAISTMFVKGTDLFVRLFNADGDDEPRLLSLPRPIQEAELVELDGRRAARLDVLHGPAGASAVKLSMPRFGIRTVRFAGVV